MDFKLSTQRANSGSAGSGLSARTLANSAGASSIRAPQVNPNAGSRGFTPTNTPQIVADQTSNSIQAFADIAIKSAQDYQDRQSTFEANQASLAFKESARKAYDGYLDEESGEFVKGYSQSTGANAVREFSRFQKKINDDMMEIVQSLEPRVQQKALAALSSTTNSLVGQAATHRNNQLKLAEDQQRAQKLKSINLDIVSNPSKIYEVDPLTKSNLKQDFYNLFELQTEADAAWEDTMTGTTSLVYQQSYKKAKEGGLSESQSLQVAANQADLFYKGIAGPELSANPEKSSRVLANLKRWNEQGIASAAQAERTSLQKSEQALKETRIKTETELTLNAERGDVLTNDQLAAYAELGYIDSDYIRMYNNDYNSVESNVTDPLDLQDIEDQLVEASKSGDFNPLLVIKQSGNKVKSLEEYKQLQELGNDLKNPLQSSKYKRLKGYSNDMIIITDVRGRRDLKQEAQLRSDASKIISEGIRNNLSEYDIMQSLEQRLPELTLNLSNSLAFPNGERPKTMEELQSTVMQYREKAQGTPPNSEERAEYRDAYTTYNDSIKKIEAEQEAQARREALLQEIRER